MTDPFVATDALKEAVQGRENDVLAALGIEWRAGKGHITCPYPDHDDKNPSWRWDAKTAKAFCTCTKADGILGVVMNVKGLTFDQAKLFVAETLGRKDLIQSLDGQKTDAASLLKPPPENRDDRLIAKYLAYRLSIDAADVPMPATPVAGWRRFAYYDRPDEPNGKPVKVGDFPCAVFGTQAADGRTHAHRVYVAPQGQGKAALGGRDPKKSATKAPGDITTGRSVLWGDPERAPTVLLAEGIETAAAVAHAFRPEIDDGTIMVAAAISTAGVKAWQPYPATRHVTVAADRDEGGRHQKQGEQAAKDFALKHHGRLSVKIALPGEAGEKIDWLDVLRADGVEAVRQGILDATAYEPIDEEQAAAPKDKGERPSQVETLLLLAKDADLFHDGAGQAFADIVVDRHRETWPVRSTGFRQWLRHRYYVVEKGAPNRESEGAALNTLEAKAVFEGPVHEVRTRVGRHGDALYLDLGDPDWRAVEIDAQGWRVVTEPPVRFRRSGGLRPLPVPERGGSIEELKPFLNVKRKDDFTLAVAWLLAAFRDQGPYTILAVVGEHGSAKSTFCRLMRALIDPNASALRTLPDDEEELFIAALKGHVLAFDNVSTIAPWLSDALCRIATGGGLSRRQLYTNDEEVLFQAQRPLILNGITEFVERPDLADRALFLELAAIADDKRKTEAEVWAGFEAKRPRLLGALLDRVSLGLRRLPTTTLTRLPRMADFALWASACLGEPFMQAYDANRAEANETVLAADPVAGAVRSLMAIKDTWQGTATDLLQALDAIVGEATAKSRDWPKRADRLGNRLKRAAPALRQVGIAVTRGREGHERTRTLHLRRSDIKGKSPSAASALSATEQNQEVTADTAVDTADTKQAYRPRTVRASPTDNHLKINDYALPADGADTADTSFPYLSEPPWMTSDIAPGRIKVKL